ncbi:flagellar motor switch protein FliG [Demequina capsici]|uniref:Flagellar motor switch protein FliG n=1 Tax=Demequina capsici TaxID=3075620 RepID=A0AA96J806_9MICO|nr:MULTISPECIES: flagellar motor switch protein FliG [unclassified Demequina]WNM24553.1 flagellar motor switch protein FliG [Demequina sp. OYTSA14]WNM27404.1 flagellar motor switch protein FliG [Demequina sp. PMTSA13]
MPAMLTGTQKAALVLIQMGKASASRVMSQMDEAEIDAVTTEITRMRSVDDETLTEVFNEFRRMSAGGGLIVQGGYQYAQKLLEETLGKEKAAEVLERLASRIQVQPFEFLMHADARQVVTVLAGEHPQTIALVLAHLRPEHASAIMAGLAPETRAIVAHRIALMGGASPDVVTLVADQLKRKAANLLTSREMTAVGGVQPLVEIINKADAATEKMILEGLQEQDPELADQIRQMMFVFADITLLEDRAIQLVMRSVETMTLATALKGAEDAVRDKILRNMSERARENLVEEIDLLGPVRISMVEEARSQVVQVIRGLEEAGEIMISRDGEDEYVA